MRILRTALLTAIAAVALCLALSAAILIAAVVMPLPEDQLHRPSSTLVLAQDGTLLRAFTSSDEKWRIETPIDQVSPDYLKMLVNFEDRWFYVHPGVNPFAIVRAAVQNLLSHRVISGGSTLTMQVARLMDPKPRVLRSKLIEAFRAIQLEIRYSKREILGLYVNMAPFGGNIEGIGAASLLYYGKSPLELSPAEAALLVALPQSPTALRPDAHPERARAARDRVLVRSREAGLLSADAYSKAINEPVPSSRATLRFYAPQLAERLHRRYPQSSVIRTTIDIRIQRLAADLLSAHVDDLRAQDVTNGAIVVIDNRSHTLLASVGSAGFFDEASSGQVDGTVSARSPGSALKPFIYGLGFASGVITPKSYLEDAPVSYSGYSPENYSNKYSGLVSVEKALSESLNVPAVNLLSMLGGDALYNLLRKASVSTIKDENRYGLSIALGGCEITLLELTGLYSALASGGTYYLPRVSSNDPPSQPVALFDPASAYLVTEILSKLERPDLPAVWQSTTLPKVAFKTGTSFGHRDAWSIGYNPDYTVGVWVGNFSGAPSKALVGADAASPLLFRIFDELARGTVTPWFSRPASVRERLVCALSGMLPGPYCDTTVTDLYIEGVSSTAQCRLHQAVFVDPESGYQVPAYLASSRNAREIRYVKWPGSVAAFRQMTGAPVYRPPSMDPAFQRQLPGSAAVITSPAPGTVYRLRQGVPAQEQKIALQASAPNDIRTLYWFVDGVLVGSGPPGDRVFYTPEKGRHSVVCQDDAGRSSAVELIVEE